MNQPILRRRFPFFGGSVAVAGHLCRHGLATNRLFAICDSLDGERPPSPKTDTAEDVVATEKLLELVGPVLQALTPFPEARAAVASSNSRERNMRAQPSMAVSGVRSSW